jgi:hypothetical protein
VTEAQLFLYVARTAADPQNVTLHRVIEPWVEGTDDAPVSGGPDQEGGGRPATNGSTWLYRQFGSTFWFLPGGTFAPEPSSSSEAGKSPIF